MNTYKITRYDWSEEGSLEKTYTVNADFFRVSPEKVAFFMTGSTDPDLSAELVAVARTYDRIEKVGTVERFNTEIDDWEVVQA